MATATYTAALTTGLADKVLSGETVAGVGGSITLPSVGDVESGVTYGVGGNGSTGTFAVPAVADVQDSVTFGSGGTEFTGTFTEPGVGNVESGVTYGGGGSEFTGTFAAPAAANVANGVNYGSGGTEFTGSATIEAHSNCIADGGTNCVATSTYAAALTTSLGDKVLSGQTVAGVAGNVTLPALADVESGVTYGVGGNGSTGSFGVPTESNVASGVGYGASGTEFTGTGSFESHSNCSSDGSTNCVATATYTAALTTSLADKVLSGQTVAGVAGNITLPAITDVESGVTYGVSGTSQTGNLSLPTTAQVASGVTFGGAGNEFTGTAATESHTDCASNGSQGCVANGSYYAATACASNGSDTCYVNPAGSYDAADLSNLLAANIKRGIDLAGVTGTFPSASSPIPRYSDTGSTTNTTGSDETDLTTFATQLKTDGTFEFWDSSGKRYTGSGDSDIVAGNIKEDVAFENLGVTGILPSEPLATPTNLAGTQQSGPDRVELSWDDMSVTGYLLVVSINTPVTWSPTSGQSYSTGSAGSDEIIYAGSLQSYSHTGITTENIFYYKLFSYNSNYFYSPTPGSVIVDTRAPIDCSSLLNGTWVGVYGDSDYGTSNFCITKFEAKKSGPGNVSAVSTSVPWVSESQSTFVSKCQAIGTGYDMQSNDHWMTVTANVANVGDNWSGGVVGSGALSRGHTDNDPTTTIDAEIDDNLGCSGTFNTCDGSTWHDQRRTYKLSNDEVIWDLSGNAWEYTSYVNASGKATPVGNAWNEFTAVGDGANLTKAMLVPTNSVKSYWSDTWTSSQGIGQYYPGTNGSGGAMMRGGAITDGTSAGIFATRLTYDSTTVYADAGFRCIAPAP